MFILESTTAGFCEETQAIWRMVGTVVNIMKIAIPIIIVLFAIIDLGKAVMAGEEKEIKEAQKMLIKRIIYGVVIFFVVTIVQAVFGLVSDNWAGESSKCWDCVTDPGSCESVQ